MSILKGIGYNFILISNGSKYSKISPLPLPMAVPPFNRKGTSLPIFLAISNISLSDILKFFAKNLKRAAESALPPPTPPPSGSFFY